jgi:hypothetical protein
MDNGDLYYTPLGIFLSLELSSQYLRVNTFADTKLPFGIMHCTENPIYVFPEKVLLGLSPNSCIHVSASFLYIPRIGSHILLQQNRQTDPGNI